MHLIMRPPHYIDYLKAVAKVRLSGAALLHHVRHRRDRRTIPASDPNKYRKWHGY
jgi:hypothetical protein